MNSLNRDRECKCECHLEYRGGFKYCGLCSETHNPTPNSLNRDGEVEMGGYHTDMCNVERGGKCDCGLNETVRTLLEEAKAEERRRCLEALPKKKGESKIPSVDLDGNYILEENYGALSFNSALDQAISAITNKTDK